jgi:predicted transcriptional regulator of viral defense system
MKPELANIPYLSKSSLGGALEKNANTLRNSLSYWEKTGKILRVKRGAYVFKDFLDKQDNALHYPRFLATKMIEPSYLSMESVLQDYQMLTDVVYGYSVVSAKKTAHLQNSFGEFHYSRIKPDLFRGFHKEQYGSLQWYVATKAKALFDFLYFRQKRFQEVSYAKIDGLRLDFDPMTPEDWEEFSGYLGDAPQKMNDIVQLIQKEFI